MVMRKGFTVHHNGPPARCIGQPHSRCESYWKGVRSFHMNDQGWSDIAYSFGICPHGHRFVGRGWDKRQFANGKDLIGADNGGDAYWYTVLCFVGGGEGTGYPEEKPTPQMIRSVAALITEGRTTGRCGYEVKPHKDWKPKACPGITLTSLCRAWDGRPITLSPPHIPTTPGDDDMFSDQDRAALKAIKAAADAIIKDINSGRIATQVWSADNVEDMPTKSGAGADMMRDIKRTVDNDERWRLLAAAGAQAIVEDRLANLEQGLADIKALLQQQQPDS